MFCLSRSVILTVVTRPVAFFALLLTLAVAALPLLIGSGCSAMPCCANEGVAIRAIVGCCPAPQTIADGPAGEQAKIRSTALPQMASAADPAPVVDVRDSHPRELPALADVGPAPTRVRLARLSTLLI